MFHSVLKRLVFLILGSYGGYCLAATETVPSGGTLTLIISGDNAAFAGAGTLNIPDSFIVGSTDTTATGVSVTSASSSNATTVNFSGSSTVVGTMGASAALKNINGGSAGSTVTFGGTLASQNITFTDVSTMKFNANANFGTLKYTGNGTAIVGSGVTLDGAINTTSANNGTLTFKGGNVINGVVGGVFLPVANINVDGNATINGYVNATNINFESASSLTLNGSSTTVTNTTTNSPGTGTLNLGDGVLFTGNIGTSPSPLSQVNVSSGSDASVLGTVFANSIGFLGTGSSITLTGNTTSGLNYGTYNGTAIIASGTFTGNATTAAANTGTLQFNTGSGYVGNIGTSLLPLGQINVTNSVTIDGIVNTNAINLLNGSILTLNGDTNANSFTVATNTGALNLGNNVDYIGNIGTSSLRLGNVFVQNASSASVTGTVFADIGFFGTNSTIALNGNTTGALNYGNSQSTAIIGSGATFTGNATTTTASTGVLTLGSGSTYNGSVGTSGNYLNTINLTGNASINGAIASKNINLGSSTLTQNGAVIFSSVSPSITVTPLSDTSYGNLNAFGSTITFPSALQINMQVNAAPPLSGTPLRVVIGSLGTAPSTINVVSSDVVNYAFIGLTRAGTANILVYPTLIVTPNYTTQFIPETTTASLIASDYNVGFTGDGNSFPSDGVLNVPNNFNLGSLNTANSVTTLNTGNGTINFLGNSTVNGNIGSSALVLRKITGGSAGTSVTFDGTVNATEIDFNHASTMTLNGNTTANTFTATTNTGVLNLGDVVYTGNIGTSPLRLNAVNVLANSSATINGTVFANTIGLLGAGTALTLNGNAIGTVSTSTPNTGSLTLDAGSVVTGAVGTNVNFLNQINLNGNATINGAIASQNINLGSNTLTQNGAVTFPSGAAITVIALSNADYGNINASGSAINFTDGLFVNMQTSTLLDPNIPMQVVTGNSGTFGPGSAPITTTSNNARFSFTGVNPAGTGNVIISAHLVPAVLPPGSIAAGAAAAFDAAAIGATGDMLFVQNQVTALNDANAIAAAEAQFAPVVNGGDAFMSMAAVNQFQHFWQSNLTKVRNAKLAGAKIVQVRHPSERFVYHNEKNSYCSSNNQDEIWVDGFGYFANQRDHMQVPGYNGNMYGLVGAFQRTLEQWQLGLGLGYAYTNVDGKGSQISSSSIDTIGGTVYLGYNSNAAWFLDGLFTFAWNHYKDSRDIIFPGLNRTAQGDYDGKEYSLLFSGGYNCATNYGFIFTPLASLQFLNLKIDEYTETGANALDLIQQNQEYNLIQASAGLMVGLPVRFDFGTLYSEVHVNFLYDLVNDQIKNASQFFGGGPLFNTYGLTPALGQINLGVSSTIFRARSLTLKLSYEVNWATNFTGQRGGITVCFTPF